MIEIVEVGPRDGYQGIKPFIPTPTKLEHLKRLFSAGLKRVEIGSIVSAKAVPQLVDTPEIFSACAALEGLTPQILVPNKKYGIAAAEIGSKFIAYVLSVSNSHNQSNVRRTPAESAKEYRDFLDAIPSGIDIRLNIATAFDCPFEGKVDEEKTLELLDITVSHRPSIEVCLCDTTGRATPDHVARLFAAAMTRFPQANRWAMHAHDTHGLGLANVYAAYQTGVRVFDSSYAGLGGCPFAPGATGNVATEDLVWMFERMGVTTNIDLNKLLEIARDGALLPGGMSGGRTRIALAHKAV